MHEVTQYCRPNNSWTRFDFSNMFSHFLLLYIAADELENVVILMYSGPPKYNHSHPTYTVTISKKTLCNNAFNLPLTTCHLSLICGQTLFLKAGRIREGLSSKTCKLKTGICRFKLNIRDNLFFFFFSRIQHACAQCIQPVAGTDSKGAISGADRHPEVSCQSLRVFWSPEGKHAQWIKIYFWEN